jgi:hypothetical protein
MPRTMQEIIDHAEAMARRFEEHEPGSAGIRDARALAAVREAVMDRSTAEQHLAEAVDAARAEGHPWSAIGAMLGTSGEAARQRYGRRRAA